MSKLVYITAYCLFTWLHITYIFFFFSSRRRHTRLQGDWSSDVYSSDLWSEDSQCSRDGANKSTQQVADKSRGNYYRPRRDHPDRDSIKKFAIAEPVILKIGRASCRERV